MDDQIDAGDLFLTNLKNWHKTLIQNLDPQPTHKKPYSLVVIRDHSAATGGHGDGDGDDDGISVFPPSNHENLIPAHADLSPRHPTSPSSPFSFPPSHLDDESSSQPPAPPSEVALFPKWWNLAVRILRSRINREGSFWSYKKVALVLTVVLWWLWARVRRRRRRSKSVEHLMQIINEKDKKIMQLLNQIAQMNELLLTRHKALISKLPN